MSKNGPVSPILKYHHLLTQRAIVAYLALASLSDEGGYCEKPQAEIAAVASISTRHLRRGLRDLEEICLIQTTTSYSRTKRRKRNVYRLTAESEWSSDHSDNMESDLSPDHSDNMESDSPPTIRTTWSPIGADHSDNMESEHDHDMIHEGKLEKEIVNYLLRWVDQPTRGRLARLEHVTPDYALRVTNYFYQGIYPKWVEKNPAGWLIRIMENGDEPPAVQMELPEETLESTFFRSRGLSSQEIEADARLPGSRLGNDGIWR